MLAFNGAGEVTGSRIGTNADGTAAVPNRFSGINLSGKVGAARPAGSDSCTGPCNLISGNGAQAVSARVIEGNFIGTDLAGTAAIPNGEFWASGVGRSELDRTNDEAEQQYSWAVSGVELGGPSDALSGMCDRACNLISGNAAPASGVAGNHADVEGNAIGLSVTGTRLPNHGAGIVLLDTGSSVIGGADEHTGFASQSGNVIADNTGPAIQVKVIGAITTAAVAPVIEGNSITGNAAGIDYEQGIPAPGAPQEVRVSFGRDGSDSFFGQIPNFFKGQAYARTIEIFGDKSREPGPQGAVPLGTFTMGSSSPDFAFTIDSVSLTLRSFTMTETYEGSTSTFSNCAS